MSFTWDKSPKTEGRAHHWLGAYPCDPIDAIICQDCGHWLPLGPAADGDERVKVEIRAAEIADEHRATGHIPKCSLDQPFEERCERCGWECFLMLKAEPHAEWHAGYLASLISHHSQTTGGGGGGTP